MYFNMEMEDTGDLKIGLSKSKSSINHLRITHDPILRKTLKGM